MKVSKMIEVAPSLIIWTKALWEPEVGFESGHSKKLRCEMRYTSIQGCGGINLVYNCQFLKFWFLFSFERKYFCWAYSVEDDYNAHGAKRFTAHRETQGRDSMGQDPGVGSWGRSHGEVLFTDLSVMVCLACLLTEHYFRKCLYSQWLGSPILLIKRFPYSQALWRPFLSWDSVPSDDKRFCQVDIKLGFAACDIRFSCAFA